MPVLSNEIDIHRGRDGVSFPEPLVVGHAEAPEKKVLLPGGESVLQAACRPVLVLVAASPWLELEPRAREQPEPAQAQVMNAKIVQGENPNDLRRTARTELTLGQLFDEYMTRHARQHKKSWRGDQAQFTRYLSMWKTRKLSAIDRRDIQSLHTKIGNTHGPYAANRLLALLHTLFGKAEAWGWWNKPNPAHRITRFKEHSRERFLQADELPRFFESLAMEPNEKIKHFVLLSLLTGARRANVQAMRWSDINMDRAEWRIPETKSGEAHTVALVPEAVQILTERQSLEPGEWVFSGPGKTGHLVEPKSAWAGILQRAGLNNLRLHDLRRTLGSWQASTGANLSIIGKSLNHKNTSTTAIYARLSMDPVRQSVETATRAMLDAAGVSRPQDQD